MPIKKTETSGDEGNWTAPTVIIGLGGGVLFIQGALSASSDPLFSTFPMSLVPLVGLTLGIFCVIVSLYKILSYLHQATH